MVVPQPCRRLWQRQHRHLQLTSRGPVSFGTWVTGCSAVTYCASLSRLRARSGRSWEPEEEGEGEEEEEGEEEGEGEGVGER